MVSFLIGMLIGCGLTLMVVFVYNLRKEYLEEVALEKRKAAHKAIADAQAAEQAKEKALLDQVAKVANENMIAMVEVQNQIKATQDARLDDLDKRLKDGEAVLTTINEKLNRHEEAATKEMDTIGTVLENFKKRLDAVTEN